jgi:hypothetical protein
VRCVACLDKTNQAAFTNLGNPEEFVADAIKAFEEANINGRYKDLVEDLRQGLKDAKGRTPLTEA